MNCGKVSYPTKADAVKDIAEINYSCKKFSKHSSVKGGKKKRAYLCPKCDQWHITTQKWNSKGKHIEHAREKRRRITGRG